MRAETRFEDYDTSPPAELLAAWGYGDTPTPREERAQEEQRDPRLERIHTVPAAWLDATHPPPPRPQLLKFHGDDFLPLGNVGIVTAEGGIGKTQVLVQLAVSVATGAPWLSEYAVEKPGRVVLLLGEEDDGECWRRIRGAFTALGFFGPSEARAVAAIESNLFVAGFAGTDVALLTSSFGNSVKRTEWAGELPAYLAGLGELSLVVCDPISRWGGPSVETDNHAATQFIQALESFAKLPGSPTVLIASHVAKSSVNNTKKTPRGASALQDGARWVATLTESENDSDSVTLTLSKANQVRRPPAVQLSRGAGGYLHFDGFAEKAGAVPLERKILAALADGSSLTANAIKTQTKRSNASVRAALDSLVKDGKIETGETAGRTTYRLSEADY